MQINKNIELRKLRDFGEIINDTFIFVRQNLKALLKTYIVICGFFLVAGVITSVFQQIKMNDLRAAGGGIGQSPYALLSDMLGVEYVLTIVFALFMYTSISLSTTAFVQLYKEKGNEAPGVEEVWTLFKFYFFRFFGGTVLIALMLFIGFVLCILPGLYLWPVLSLIAPIMVIENASFGYAFTRSFTLIKDNWLPTFGVLIVVSIIVGVGSTISGIPVMLAGFVSAFAPGSKLFVPLLIAGTALQYLFQALLIIPSVTICLVYFNLCEQKEGTSLIERINLIKKQEPKPQPDLPSEQY